MKRELTLTDIAGYLPYDLKVQDRDRDIWVLCQLGNADPCMDGDIGLTTDDGDYLQYDYLDDIKPVLRPMSDLYRGITERGYNNGKPFVPIMELANLIGDAESCQWAFQPENRRVYSGEYSWCFRWDFDSRAFVLADSPQEDVLGHVIPNVHNLYDALHRLHFDYRGLIPAGLAVSVYDLSTNPYEA